MTVPPSIALARMAVRLAEQRQHAIMFIWNAGEAPATRAMTMVHELNVHAAYYEILDRINAGETP